MSKNNDHAKSIDLGEDSDHQDDAEDLTESERQERIELREETEKVSYWNINPQTRDHAVQMIMKLSANLGSNVDGKFIKGLYARKNIDGIREYISHKDDKETREIMILISTLKIMPKLVVPLFECSGDDAEIMVPLLKLFLALTRGLTTKKRQESVARVREKPLNKESKQDCLRRVKKAKDSQRNAYEQISALMFFKEAIVSEEVFAIIYEYVDGPILKKGNRTAEELKSIETVLFLVSNLLQIQAGPFSMSTEQIRSRSLQNKLILILKKTDFFDLFHVLCTSLNAQGNTQWNGLMMTILHHLLWCVTASTIFVSDTVLM